MRSASVNEFNVQLLEWGVRSSGHVQWFVAAASITAAFAASLNVLCCCWERSWRKSPVLLQADRSEPSWHSEVWHQRLIQSAHSRLHHAAQPFSFPETLFSLKTCLKGIFTSVNSLWSQFMGERKVWEFRFNLFRFCPLNQLLNRLSSDTDAPHGLCVQKKHIQQMAWCYGGRH